MLDFAKQICMLCSNVGLNFINDLRDDNTHLAAECPFCGHVQVTPLPSIEEENTFYQTNEMNRRLISKEKMDDGQMMIKYEIWGDEQYSFISRMLPLPKYFRILEVGSGYGWFVEKMKMNGFSIDGIELSTEKRTMAQKRAGIELLSYNLLADDLPLEVYEKYDLICMFHVLEHITDPVFFLKQTLKALKPGGRLLVVVPNYFDKLKQLSVNFNNFTFFRAHLSYFKPETLRLCFNKSGLVDTEITGMQLYSLENAVHWLRAQSPFLEYSQIRMPEGLEWIGDIYKRTLEKDLVSDGIVAIGTKL